MNAAREITGRSVASGDCTPRWKSSTLTSSSGVGIADLEHDHEAVDLRGGQRVRALVIDRVHRREHLERLVEAMGHAVDRHAALLHHLEQRRLRLGRGAVDLVGEQDVREHRPRPEVELLVAHVEHVRAGDVHRQQVGRELDAAEPRLDRRRERLAQLRLADARHVDEQHVAARRHRAEHALDDVALADDHRLDRRHDAPVLVADALDVRAQRRSLDRLQLRSGRVVAIRSVLRHLVLLDSSTDLVLRQLADQPAHTGEPARGGAGGSAAACHNPAYASAMRRRIGSSPASW